MATATDQAATTAGRDTRRGNEADACRSRAAFWMFGYTFAVTMAFSAVPTPLHVLYQAREGFGRSWSP